MSFDIYRETDLLIKLLNEDDEITAANELNSAIYGGATSTEILMALRFYLNKLITGGTSKKLIIQRAKKIEDAISKLLQ